jgi:hypothetical protein
MAVVLVRSVVAGPIFLVGRREGYWGLPSPTRPLLWTVMLDCVIYLVGEWMNGEVVSARAKRVNGGRGVVVDQRQVSH